MTQTTDNTKTAEPVSRPLLLAIIAVGALLPLISYWLILGRLPMVTPAGAKDLLRRPGSAAVLLDVDTTEAFAARHIDGAQSWPLADILALRVADEMPTRFKGKTLLLLCRAGVQSGQATRHLQGLAVPAAFNVRGGEMDWIGTAPGPDGDVFDQWRTASGEISPFPFRASTWYEQFALVASGFGLKTAYTLLSLTVAIVLWRSRAPDMIALRWAMVCFFLGENACTANYFAFSDTAYLLEYLHSVGMVLCFGFTAYAVVEGMDRRIFMVSDPSRKCAALSLCNGCVKHADAPCGLKRTFYLIVAACIVLAFVPLCSPWHNLSYNTFVYRAFFHFGHPWVYQAFELRYCPALAVVLLGASLLILLLKKRAPLGPGKLFFAAGIGPLGFAYLRMILASTFAENKVWFNFWEEATELLFICGVCFVLWIFRHALLGRNLGEQGRTTGATASRS